MTLLDDHKKDAVCNSKSGNIIARALDRAHDAMPDEVHEVLHPYLLRLDERHYQKHHPELSEEGGPGAESTSSNLPLIDPAAAAQELLEARRQADETNR